VTSRRTESGPLRISWPSLGATIRTPGWPSNGVRGIGSTARLGLGGGWRRAGCAGAAGSSLPALACSEGGGAGSGSASPGPLAQDESRSEASPIAWRIVRR